MGPHGPISHMSPQVICVTTISDIINGNVLHRCSFLGKATVANDFSMLMSIASVEIHSQRDTFLHTKCMQKRHYVNVAEYRQGNTTTLAEIKEKKANWAFTDLRVGVHNTHMCVYL